jgi:hypothetical protein
MTIGGQSVIPVCYLTMEHTEQREPRDVITSDTENATVIRPREASKDLRAKFRRFREYNRGTYNGPKRENTELIRRQDDLHRYDSIASKVLLTRYQKERGRKIFDGLDFHDFGGGIDQIIFGVCVFVANQEVDSGARFYPNPHTPDDEDFENMAESLGLTSKQQISAIEKVRNQVDV